MLGGSQSPITSVPEIPMPSLLWLLQAQTNKCTLQIIKKKMNLVKKPCLSYRPSDFIFLGIINKRLLLKSSCLFQLSILLLDKLHVYSKWLCCCLSWPHGGSETLENREQNTLCPWIICQVVGISRRHLRREALCSQILLVFIQSKALQQWLQNKKGLLHPSVEKDFSALTKYSWDSNLT